MVKKLLSFLAVLLCVFSMDTNAQTLQSSGIYLDQAIAGYAANDAVTSGLELNENEYWTGYWDGEANHMSSLGVNKTPTNYDVAIHFPAGSFFVKNHTIEGIKFALRDSANIEDVSIWISKKLPRKAEDADIVYQEVKDFTCLKAKDNPFNEIRFDNPYVVNPLEEFYVGYSFTVTKGDREIDKLPVCSSKVKGKANSFFLKSTNNGWMDFSEKDFGLACIQVLICGDIKDDYISLKADAEKLTKVKGTEYKMPIVVTNKGKSFDSLEGSIEINGEQTPFSRTLSKTYDKVNGDYTFDVNVHIPDNTGFYDYKIVIDKVNGVSDEFGENVSTGSLTVLSRLTDRKVLFETFAGMWNEWVPKAYIAVDKVHQVFGDKVVCVTVHNQDALECKDYKDIIKETITALPGAHVDRNIKNVDPWWGKEETDFALEKDFNEFLTVHPVAEITAMPKIEGDVVTAKANVKFLYTGDASRYAIGYVITENGMTNKDWVQQNVYTQFKHQGLEDKEPLYKPWIFGEKEQKGVIFNDVAIAAKGMMKGIEGSIPATVKEEEPNVFSQDFNLKDYKKIIDKTNLKLVVVLFDTVTGQVVNSDIKPINERNQNIHVAIKTDIPEITTIKDTDFQLPVVVTNKGNGFSSIEGTINIDGVNMPFTKKLSHKFNKKDEDYAFEITAHAPAKSGIHNYRITIDKVDGVINMFEDGVATGSLLVLSRAAEHKVFMENFTGMWTGYAPRGLVAVEKIQQVYGDKVICVNVHDKDALHCNDYEEFVEKTITGIPTAHVDRATMDIDPWFGDSDKAFAIKEDIDAALQTLPVAEIKAMPIVEGDIVKANANIDFLYTGNASKYAVGYLIIEDGMKDDKWIQENNYVNSSDEGFKSEPLFTPWLKGENHQKDVTFDKVVIAAKGVEKGVAGSVPEEVKEGVSTLASEEFDLSAYSKITDKSKLNLVVLLFDTETGKVVNADVQPLDISTGIEQVTPDGEEVKEVARYTINGYKIKTPVKGVNIIVYSDGTTKKVIVR